MFAIEPEYYINLVNNYKCTRNGEEIYLPNLLNIKTSRTKGKFVIKFRLNDNDRWEEVGYDGNCFTDDDVYSAFSHKVALLLRRPRRGDSRAHLNTELTPDAETTAMHSAIKGSTNPTVPRKTTNERQNVEKKVSCEETDAKTIQSSQVEGLVKKKADLQVIPPSQGRQDKITKIDRYLGKAAVKREIPINYESENVSESESDRECDSEDDSSDNSSYVDLSESDNDNDTDHDSVLHEAITEHKKSLLNHMRSVLPAVISSTYNNMPQTPLQKKLAKLQRHCPKRYRSQYETLLTNLSQANDSKFTRQLLELLPQATMYELPYLHSFIAELRDTTKNNYVESLNHDQICNALNLDSSSRRLLRNYKIDLKQLWNDNVEK